MAEICETTMSCAEEDFVNRAPEQSTPHEDAGNGDGDLDKSASHDEEDLLELSPEQSTMQDDEEPGDFTVVDEASNSASDFTDDEELAKAVGSGPKEEEQQTIDLRNYPPELRAPRIYSEKDFHPTERDPRCKEDWPLAAYWPVYVGNFRMMLPTTTSDKPLIKNVQKYFASKGLPSFMVYLWKDNFYKEYQQYVGVYDMLVYFCSEQDANRAVEWCNRDLYFGHRLNVYSGRSPALFSKQKSWRMTHLRENDRRATEQTLETHLRRYGDIRCITKQDLDGVLVQYGHTFHDGIETFAREERFRCAAVSGPVSKQRFLEQDVESEIQHIIDTKPSFMDMRINESWTSALKKGLIPTIWKKWEQTEEELRRSQLQKTQSSVVQQVPKQPPPPPIISRRFQKAAVRAIPPLMPQLPVKAKKPRHSSFQRAAAVPAYPSYYGQEYYSQEYYGQPHVPHYDPWAVPQPTPSRQARRSPWEYPNGGSYF